ncbi:glycerol-3-phosphate acyltransferase [Rosettibacter firmus]|uniref:glycerol-3-phosphate acyltransferase n=1 Tax=Rosettibacter firmus TaxID=3111522 RepID=UPI00336C0980
MSYIFSALIGIIIGSFPTAYLILKKIKNIDITKAGTGNVGAMNSFEVTQSRTLGLLVFIIDFLKGFLTVYIVKNLFGNEFSIIMISLIGAVFSHCFSFWIKFRGGRGLATAAGGASLLSLPILGIWILLWLISYAFRRNIHFGNFSATLLTGALSFSSSEIMNKYTNPSANSNLEFSILVSLMLLIILIKHIKPIKEYFARQNLKTREKENE